MRQLSDEEIVADSTATPTAAPVQQRRSWLRWAIGASIVGLLLCLALGGLRLSFTLFRNGGDGMVPTVTDRQMLVVNRLSYARGGTPQRGDLIVFEAPLRPRAIYVKRIIALPGDTVAIRQGLVSINGQPIDEPYINARTTYQYPLAGQGPMTIPDGHVFVLGDNRNNSADSHVYGPVAIDAIIGKASALR